MPMVELVGACSAVPFGVGWSGSCHPQVTFWRCLVVAIVIGVAHGEPMFQAKGDL